MRRELCRLAGGEIDRLTPAAAAHLADCPACRKEAERPLRLVAMLTSALSATDWPAALDQRIRAQWRSGGSRKRAAWRLVSWLSCTAAAAAVLAGAWLWPMGGFDRAVVSGGALVELTPAEAEAITAAYALMTWDSPADYAVTVLSDRVADTARAASREQNTRTWLPWSSDDDWDMPADHPGTRVPGMDAPAA